MRTRVLLSTGVANAISYAGMAASAWAMYPAEGMSMVRPYVAEAMIVASSKRLPVDEFWQNNERFPKDAAEAGMALDAPSRFTVALLTGGRIEVQFRVENAKLNGKRLILTPDAADGPKGLLKWSCGSPDIEERFLPASCRRR